MAAINPSIGCIDAGNKRVLADLFTRVSSEEVMDDKSLIFVIIGGEKSRTMDGIPGHNRRQ